MTMHEDAIKISDDLMALHKRLDTFIDNHLDANGSDYFVTMEIAKTMDRMAETAESISGVRGDV